MERSLFGTLLTPVSMIQCDGESIDDNMTQSHHASMMQEDAVLKPGANTTAINNYFGKQEETIVLQ